MKSLKKQNVIYDKKGDKQISSGEGYIVMNIKWETEG